MKDVEIRKSGRAGRITLTRPKVLNALSPAMSLEIEAALDGWEHEGAVDVVVIDAEGERAFCAGGDIADIYHHGVADDEEFARAFWRQEYRMNAKIARYPKPVVAFMQGFTMGGGVGVGCHAAYRVVGRSTQIAMPEASIGLIPDVGGTLLLAHSPGRLGEYLGLTGARMGAADAIYAGFADMFIPEEEWPGLISGLEASGNPASLSAAVGDAGDAPLAAEAAEIDRIFSGHALRDIVRALDGADTEACQKARDAVQRNSPLSMACTLELVRRARGFNDIEAALAQEYRFTHRVQAGGDLLEGVLAQIIDKDRNPKWMHKIADGVPAAAVAHMLAPLGDLEWSMKEEFA